MKIKAINLNQTSVSTARKSKCWTSYHEWMNSPRCNKAMTIVFCLSILGLFGGMVALTISRTHQADARVIPVDTCDSCPQVPPKALMDHLEEGPHDNNCSIVRDCKVYCCDVREEDLKEAIESFDLKNDGCTFIELELERCKFVDNCLDEYWLSELNVKVTKLEIINSSVTYIRTNAFNSEVFGGNLLSLKIDNSLNKAKDSFVFQIISKESFNGLTSLGQLIITNNPTLQINDPKFLQYLNDSLTDLTISRIANPWSLTMALSRIVLKNIATLDLQSNHIPALDNTAFTGVAENAKILFLTNSQIQTIAANTFTNFENLQKLYMQSNLLTTLPVGVFDSLLVNGVVVTLEKNKWHCDCFLVETQKMIANNQGVFLGAVKCATPEALKDIEIIRAELCPLEDTTIPFSSQSEVVGGCDEENPDEEACPQTNEISTETTLSTEQGTDSPATSPAPTTIETDPSTKAPDPTTEGTDPPTTSPDPSTTSPDPTTVRTDPPTTSPDPTTERTDPTTTPAPSTTPALSTTPAPTTTTEVTKSSEETPPDEQKSTLDCLESVDDCSTTLKSSTSTTPTTTYLPSSSPTTSISLDSNKSSTVFETTTVSRIFYLNVECSQGTIQSKESIATIELPVRKNRPKVFPPGYNEVLYLLSPEVSFDFERCDENQIQISLQSNYYMHEIFLVYYLGFLDVGKISNENIQNSIHCQIVVSSKILIKDLSPSTVYTFCALLRNQPIISPFQCKSSQTKTPFQQQTWMYQEQKVIILTSFLVLLFFTLLIGVVMTYLLIRRMPRLMRGSKRVVMVNNRTKDVMVMPSGSRNNSWQKETTTPIKAEPPTYLTPLPRKSFENKPPLIRSNSDSSLKSARSYVCVSRAPPRFSQVFQPSDFKHELPRRCGSFPHCQPIAPPCHTPDPIPPPLPRRSIASTASSVEMGKRSNNSIYRRQPSRIEDETENHYNFIV